MPIVRRWQQAPVHHIQRQVVDATSIIGERFVILRAKHPYTDPNAERCPDCYDEIYHQSSDPTKCLTCFGTTYKEPFKEVVVSRGIINVGETEKKNKTGEYNSHELDATIEPYPLVYKNDFLIRVDEWENYDTPHSIFGIYNITKTKRLDMNSGTNNFATTQLIGHVISLAKLPESHAIYSYVPKTPIPLPQWPMP